MKIKFIKLFICVMLVICCFLSYSIMAFASSGSLDLVKWIEENNLTNDYYVNLTDEQIWDNGQVPYEYLIECFDYTLKENSDNNKTSINNYSDFFLLIDSQNYIMSYSFYSKDFEKFKNHYFNSGEPVDLLSFFEYTFSFYLYDISSVTSIVLDETDYSDNYKDVQFSFNDYYEITPYSESISFKATFLNEKQFQFSSNGSINLNTFSNSYVLTGNDYSYKNIQYNLINSVSLNKYSILSSFYFHLTSEKIKELEVNDLTFFNLANIAGVKPDDEPNEFEGYEHYIIELWYDDLIVERHYFDKEPTVTYDDIEHIRFYDISRNTGDEYRKEIVDKEISDIFGSGAGGTTDIFTLKDDGRRSFVKFSWDIDSARNGLASVPEYFENQHDKTSTDERPNLHGKDFKYVMKVYYNDELYEKVYFESIPFVNINGEPYKRSFTIINDKTNYNTGGLKVPVLIECYIERDGRFITYFDDSSTIPDNLNPDDTVTDITTIPKLEYHFTEHAVNVDGTLEGTYLTFNWDINDNGTGLFNPSQDDESSNYEYDKGFVDDDGNVHGGLKDTNVSSSDVLGSDFNFNAESLDDMTGNIFNLFGSVFDVLPPYIFIIFGVGLSLIVILRVLGR